MSYILLVLLCLVSVYIWDLRSKVKENELTIEYLLKRGASDLAKALRKSYGLDNTEEE